RRRRQLLVDDLVAEVDALVADVDAGTGDQLLDLPLRLPAEAAEKLLVGVGWTCQGLFPCWLRISEPAPSRLRNPARRERTSVTRPAPASLQPAAGLQNRLTGRAVAHMLRADLATAEPGEAPNEAPTHRHDRPRRLRGRHPARRRPT